MWTIYQASFKRKGLSGRGESTLDRIVETPSKPQLRVGGLWQLHAAARLSGYPLSLATLVFAHAAGSITTRAFLINNPRILSQKFPPNMKKLATNIVSPASWACQKLGLSPGQMVSI